MQTHSGIIISEFCRRLVGKESKVFLFFIRLYGGLPFLQFFTPRHPLNAAGIIGLPTGSIYLILGMRDKAQIATPVIQPIAVDVVNLHNREAHDDAVQKFAGRLASIGVDVTPALGRKNVPIHIIHKSNVLSVNDGFIAPRQGEIGSIAFNPDLADGAFCHTHVDTPIAPAQYLFAANRSIDMAVQ